MKTPLLTSRCNSSHTHRDWTLEGDQSKQFALGVGIVLDSRHWCARCTHLIAETRKIEISWGQAQSAADADLPNEPPWSFSTRCAMKLSQCDARTLREEEWFGDFLSVRRDRLAMHGRRPNTCPLLASCRQVRPDCHLWFRDEKGERLCFGHLISSTQVWDKAIGPQIAMETLA